MRKLPLAGIYTSVVTCLFVNMNDDTVLQWRLYATSVCFVVDLNMLDDPLDIRADENGVWNRKGSPVPYVNKYTDKGKTRFFRRNKAPTQANHYKITRTYYRHASSPDFTRIITIVHGEILMYVCAKTNREWVTELRCSCMC